MSTKLPHWRGRLCVVLLGLVCAICPLWAASLDTPLPVDPAVHQGELENGMTYWVRSHATPPGKITFWLHVATGSLNEVDGQEGMAHFLEHLAFNGTEHFPPGELLTYFESIGLRFGQHQNAFTGFDQTTYTLTLPNTQPETLDKGLLCLADFAFRMLILPEEIDKERGVILEEKRARKGVGQRLIERLLPELAPNSRVARRLPIGLETTIARLQRDDFLAYYSTWYHPAKVTILAVGDAPVETITAAITKHFGAWHRDTPPPEDLDAAVQPYTAPRAIVITDPELTSAGVEFMALRPQMPRTTLADFRQRVIERLGTWMLNRRLGQRIQEGQAPYQNAGARISRFLAGIEQISAEAETDAADWTAALIDLITEIQRARLYGFTPQEFKIATKALLAAAEHAAQTESTRNAHAFIGAMNRALSVGEQPRSAVQNVALLLRVLPDIMLGEVAATFRTHFAPERKAYLLTLPKQAGLAVPSREELFAVVQQGLNEPVEPWQVDERPTALLEEIPLPGAIADQTHVAPLGITQVTFANHVRLHYRFMDFKKDQVTVTITLPGGAIQEQPDQRGITAVAALPLSTPATSQFSATDIRDLMTGKKVQVQGSMAADALQLSITGTPEALEEGFQLAYLLLQDAKIEPASVALWERQRLQDIAAMRTQIRTRAKETARLALSGNDPRFAMLTPEQVQARANAIPAAQVWLDTILRTAPMEVAIVGDIPEARALALAATYFGSLPDRPPHDPSLEPLRHVQGFTGPLTQTIEVETITPQARPILMWRSVPWQDVRGRRLMFMAARILERRMRQEVREERGLTYSTATYARPSKVYPAMSALYVEFTAGPDKVEEAAAVAQAVAERFAAEGPTDAEMETVRKQIRNNLETRLQEPNFWSWLLADLDYHGTRLADIEGLVEKMMAFTKADVAAAIRQAVTPEHFAMVIARPTSPASASEASQKTPPASAVQ